MKNLLYKIVLVAILLIMVIPFRFVHVHVFMAAMGSIVCLQIGVIKLFNSDIIDLDRPKYRAVFIAVPVSVMLLLIAVIYLFKGQAGLPAASKSLTAFCAGFTNLIGGILVVLIHDVRKGRERIDNIDSGLI